MDSRKARASIETSESEGLPETGRAVALELPAAVAPRLRPVIRLREAQSTALNRKKIQIALLVAVLLVTGSAAAFFLFWNQEAVGAPEDGEVHVAAAANFAEPIKVLARRFEETTGYKVTLSLGSTGKLYAQIKNGAPFGVFLAADIERPKRLEAEGDAVPGSRFTYAVGKVVLWSDKTDFVDREGGVLAEDTFRHLAITNPELAPYGMAAREILEVRGVWDRLQGKIVRGENVIQTSQFVQSGNAELGFVALSQVRGPGKKLGGSYWLVPQSLYTPLEQQTVLLKDNAAARAFLDFVCGAEASDLIRSYGYDLP